MDVQRLKKWKRDSRIEPKNTVYIYFFGNQLIYSILGYKSLAVIQGDVDAYVHVTLIKKWDICAGNAILNAIHGNMTTLDGLSIDYGSQEEYKNEGGVLATLYLHKYYLPKLQELRKKKPH